MKNNFRRIVSIILALTVITGVFSINFVSSSAANYTSNYKNYSAPSDSGDYAYWNGKKVVKASGTTVSEIKWMQSSLNSLIDKGIISCKKLDVDGSFGPASAAATKKFQAAMGLTQDSSFGPASIKKMKSVLSTKSDISSNGKVTTSAIQSILNKYGYADGKYWTLKETNNTKSDCSKVKYTRSANLYAGGNKATVSGNYKSFNYENQWECHGFACYVMAKVTGTDVIPRNGNTTNWTKITKPTSLKVGDIVRAPGHTAVVLSVDSNGNCTFAECWGSVNSQINIGKFNNKCTTLSSIKNNYGVEYVYRYTGK
ncbi:MAG: peptidoglycan-binding protein [Ruminococcaceae bacterium]|nr:peptidoglycan-binding protein [Oscillospiraceae bacterium]